MTEDGESGGALHKIVTAASDALVESVSSLAGSAVDEGASRLYDCSLHVCKENLNIMANDRSF
jgi:hypothetical protein